MVSFAVGFEYTMRVILCITGGAAAVLLSAILLGIIALAAGAVFHAVTESLACRWEEAGKTPNHLLARIIMRNRER